MPPSFRIQYLLSSNPCGTGFRGQSAVLSIGFHHDVGWLYAHGRFSLTASIIPRSINIRVPHKVNSPPNHGFNWRQSVRDGL